MYVKYTRLLYKLAAVAIKRSECSNGYMYLYVSLSAGQQLVKLPGGKFQVMTPKRTIPAVAGTTPRATQPSTPATQIVRMQTPAGVVTRTIVAPTATPEQQAQQTSVAQLPNTGIQVRNARVDVSKLVHHQTQTRRIETTCTMTCGEFIVDVFYCWQPAPAASATQLVQIQVPGQATKQLLMSAEQLQQLQALQAQGNVNINLQPVSISYFLSFSVHIQCGHCF